MERRRHSYALHKLFAVPKHVLHRVTGQWPYGRAHVCIGWQLVYQPVLGLAWLWAALGQLSLPVHLEGLESLHQHINSQINYTGKERNTKSKDTGDYA